jgi:hypothetical protein
VTEINGTPENYLQQLDIRLSNAFGGQDAIDIDPVLVVHKLMKGWRRGWI